ncbi:Sec-independent protein translocase subunit TatB [Streptomyces sp. BHT-5-2]|uniref:sec-independent translocase n=1 Tax=unclassified Streptomyces TaxID=2593676 RepID=UPI001C8D9523|nr:sec-independent translocase [Streptomyces sp. BHT-5-2]QZL03804.1 Sec-independent protein translocase subunit TatB [Streptomyces sp. BHT-5-2]
MFFDIGPLELVALVVLAVLIFGPDKLPKVIQDVTGFIRKVRAFSDSAKEDIRSELGPEFKDFEFEDLKPRNFVRKHVLEKDEYGLRDLAEIREGFDLKKEMAEVTEAVRETTATRPASAGGPLSLSKETPAASAGRSDMLSKSTDPSRREPPPFDADAT